MAVTTNPSQLAGFTHRWSAKEGFTDATYGSPNTSNAPTAFRAPGTGGGTSDGWTTMAGASGGTALTLLQSAWIFQKNIAGVLAANPGVVYTTAAHLFTQGQLVNIRGCTTTPTINGEQIITVPSQPSGTITAGVSTTGNPTTITTDAPHGLTTGEYVTLAGFTTTPDTINGTWVVTVTGASTFTIAKNVTGGGDYTGTWNQYRFYVPVTVTVGGDQSGTPTPGACVASGPTTAWPGGGVCGQPRPNNALESTMGANYPAYDTGTRMKQETGATIMLCIRRTNSTAVLSSGNISSVSAVNDRVTTSAAHGLRVGDLVTIAGTSCTPDINGTYTVATVPSTTTFTIGIDVAAVTTGTGTWYAINASYLSVPFQADRVGVNNAFGVVLDIYGNVYGSFAKSGGANVATTAAVGQAGCAREIVALFCNAAVGSSCTVSIIRNASIAGTSNAGVSVDNAEMYNLSLLNGASDGQQFDGVVHDVVTCAAENSSASDLITAGGLIRADHEPVAFAPTIELDLIGDSITAGWCVTNCCTYGAVIQEALHPSVLVFPHGIAGAMSAHWANQTIFNNFIAASANAYSTITRSVGLIYLGTNDLVADVTAATFKANIATIAGYYLSRRGVKPYALVPLAISSGSNQATRESLRRDYRTALIELVTAGTLAGVVDTDTLAPWLVPSAATAYAVGEAGASPAFQCPQNAGTGGLKLDGANANSGRPIGISQPHPGPIGHIDIARMIMRDTDSGIAYALGAATRPRTTILPIPIG